MLYTVLLNEQRRSLRIEGHKEPLIENHGGVTTGHADRAVWCFAVYHLRRGYITGSEIGCRVKPHPSAHAHEKCSSDEVVLQVVAIVPVVVRGLWWGPSWGRRWAGCSCAVKTQLKLKKFNFTSYSNLSLEKSILVQQQGARHFMPYRDVHFICRSCTFSQAYNVFHDASLAPLRRGKLVLEQGCS